MDVSSSCRTTAGPRSHRRSQLRVRAAVLALPLLIATAATAHAAPAKCTVTVLHGLPPSAYDVYVNGKLTLDGFKAESSTSPLPFATGHYNLAIRNVGAPPTDTPVAEASVDLLAGKNYSVIPHLDGGGSPMISLFDNDLSKIAAGRARLELRDVGEVQTFDLRLNGAAVFTNVTPGADTTITRAPGSFSLDAVATGQSSSLIGATSLVLREGQTTVVYVVGSSAAHTLDFMVQDVTNLATSPADVATGSGGLAARSSGVPAWVIATMICAAVGVAGSVRALRA